VLIGGVTDSNYILKTLLDHPYYKDQGFKFINHNGWVHEAINPKDPDNYYQKIIELDCEQFFDTKTINFLGKIWLLGLPWGLWDRFGDYFKAITDKKRMSAISTYINRKLELLQINEGYELDVVGHSLGSLLLTQIERPVNKVMMIGSPLTSKHWAVRATANNFVTNNRKNWAWRKLLYCWNKADRVSTKPYKGIERITTGSRVWMIQQLKENEETALNLEIGCGHGAFAYFDDLIKLGVLN
jgi:hypothetical protein